MMQLYSTMAGILSDRAVVFLSDRAAVLFLRDRAVVLFLSDRTVVFPVQHYDGNHGLSGGTP
jgi:hypothetical protein